MTLFEECKEALGADFRVIDGDGFVAAMNVLKKYPVSKNGVVWEELSFKDYDGIEELLSGVANKIDGVYVLADDAEIPLFCTNLKLIAENIYAVTALSPKLLIFNDRVIMQPLFPTEMIRLGYRIGEER
ncbi:MULTISPECIES: hypothetical protein [Pseudomonas]|uniref:Uncharacterized protein n=2 Tax=Pseudomonadaceae TaxID=135621 RepID=A0A0D0KP36_9PSED|nr:MULTISPECIES: hypothetical protein [Pseudomonas]KIP98718.1 hypothetical protein RU08_14640 [Pseudomonas fulva]MCW2292767.1 hypothetical protein [Pseudomonas sp. BIGb0408]NYH72663.1 hypothetical protein [Pseudomonas flavescens]